MASTKRESSVGSDFRLIGSKTLQFTDKQRAKIRREQQESIQIALQRQQNNGGLSLR